MDSHFVRESLSSFPDSAAELHPFQSRAIPYTNIRCQRLIGPMLIPGAPLRNVPYRLNLLTADGDILYIVHSEARILRLRINRARGLVLVPLSAVTISPPAFVNNIRIADFSEEHGGKTLIMAAGRQDMSGSGHIVILPLHDDPSMVSSFARSLPILTDSAWGLDVHSKTGRFIVSSNSFGAKLYSFRSHPNETDQLNPSEANVHGPDLASSTDDFRHYLIEHEPALYGTHSNNVPCACFHHDGDTIATASIDSTFAIYDFRRKKHPCCFQSGKPISPSLDFSRRKERCWQVLWIKRSTPIPVTDTDKVWLEHSRQHRNFSPLLTSRHYSRSYPERNSLFTRHLNSVRHTQTNHFYDDNQILEPSHKADAENRKEADELIFDNLDFDIASFFDKPTNSRHLVSRSSTNQLPCSVHVENSNTAEKDDQKWDGDILLVCYEKIIALYHIPADCTRKTATASDPAGKIRRLDAMYFNTSTYSQLMFTNVIEVNKLNLLILTTVETGIIILRILEPPRTMQVSEPSIYIERIISTPTHVVGTCVIERPGDTESSFSVELWILTADGLIQCWDLSRGEVAVDLSVPI